MLNYVSTRGYGLRTGDKPKTFVDVMIEGLAPDGGLYVPAAYPRLSGEELNAMRGMSPARVAYKVMRKFSDGAIPDDALLHMCAQAYSPANFGNGMRDGNPNDIVPLVNLYAGRYLAELSNGPTLAFKDFAILLLGYLLSYAYERGCTSGREIIILVATSGDTGPATVNSLKALPGIRVFCISGKGLPTELQADQMHTILADNVHNIVIRGDFDKGQLITKALMNDAEFRSRYFVGSANSINWARIAAQSVYYFLLYLAATETEDQKVDFAVQAGNCGNFLSGYIAKTMRLPIRKFYVVTNENTVFTDFLKTGVYRPMGKSKETSSPAMDVDNPSNFERYLHMMLGGDWQKVVQLLELQKEQLFFDIAQVVRWQPDADIVAGSCDHKGRLEAARKVYRETGIILDPHTANAVHFALLQYREADNVPMIFLETAQPAKFEKFVRKAHGVDPLIPESARKLRDLPKRFVELPAETKAVKDYIVSVLG